MNGEDHSEANPPAPPSEANVEPQRLDKWLWAARFFKTRSLAAEAVSGGKVHVDGERVKPARRIRPGARLDIRRGEVRFELEVLGVARQRRPASEAQALYRETEESRVRRKAERARHRERAATRERGLGRPTKRERRALERLGRLGETPDPSD